MILSGRAGGMPFEALAGTVASLDGPVLRADRDDREPDQVGVPHSRACSSWRMTPIRDAVSGQEKAVQIVYPNGGFFWNVGNVATSATMTVRLRPDPVPAPGRVRELRHADLDQPGLTMLEAALRRDRFVTAAGLAALCGLAWAYVARMAAMPRRGTCRLAMPSMPGMVGGEAPGLAWLIGMWVVMMVAMMLPSAAPTILLFAGGVAPPPLSRAVPAVPVAVFTAGIPARCGPLYAAVAASAQWELHRLACCSPRDGERESGARRRPARSRPVSTSGCRSSRACLSHCRSPHRLLLARSGAKAYGARSPWACGTAPTASDVAGC